MSAPLFHITSEDAWASARQAGIYEAPSLRTEGFIHLSTAEQVDYAGREHYAGVPGLLLLELDPSKLRAEVRYEVSVPGMPPFPHLYGPLELDAVVGVTAVAYPAG